MTEANEAEKSSQPQRPGRGGKGRGSHDGIAEVTRFFVAKSPTNGGVPVLGPEFSTEGEACGEAYRTDLSYFVVSERTWVGDFTGKTALIRGEPIRPPRKGEP